MGSEIRGSLCACRVGVSHICDAHEVIEGMRESENGPGDNQFQRLERDVLELKEQARRQRDATAAIHLVAQETRQRVENYSRSQRHLRAAIDFLSQAVASWDNRLLQLGAGKFELQKGFRTSLHLNFAVTPFPIRTSSRREETIKRSSTTGFGGRGLE